VQLLNINTTNITTTTTTTAAAAATTTTTTVIKLVHAVILHDSFPPGSDLWPPME